LSRWGEAAEAPMKGENKQKNSEQPYYISFHALEDIVKVEKDREEIDMAYYVNYRTIYSR
jgi:hypothetical protein